MTTLRLSARFRGEINMSELINTHDNRATIRWKLLTGASAVALTAYVSTIDVAKAEDANRPLIWIELGGQMEQLQGLATPFTAPFMSAVTPTPDVYGKGIFTKGQRPPRFAFGGDGKITFQPEDSDWVFSANIRYGRSHARRHAHQQGAVAVAYQLGLHGTKKGLQTLYAAPFADDNTQYQQNHAIVDFSAGKDVGIGRFGPQGTSVVSAGVRFAQFSENSSTHISARPFVGYSRTSLLLHIPHATFDNYAMQAHADRSFKGVGPSLSWNASAVIAGNPEHTELMLDWGIDGAVLFGHQNARTDHATSAYHYSGGKAKGHKFHQLYTFGTHSHHRTVSRRVTVPDASAFIGLSFKLPHSKISFGYKGDIWFKANDRGIDARKDSNLTFNGPYASISIGLGD
jgi:hypothetical protein